MKKHFKVFTAMSTIMILTASMHMVSFAEPKASSASLDHSAYLRYEPQSLTGDTDQVTVTGYFINVSSDKDIYGITDTQFVINDANGNPAITTTLNSGDLSEVQLGPGEKWNYSVVRTISGFSVAAYNVQTFSTSVSCEFSIRNHDSNCSYCSSRNNTSFNTEDTMSEEQWQMLLAKLKEIQKDSPSGNSSSNAADYTPAPYTPITVPEAHTRNCRKCGGSGKLICEHCNGVGYKEWSERVFCLVAHHTDCTGNCHGSCHKRHDVYIRKDKCIRCEGTGMERCSSCHGTGTLNY